MLTALHGYAAGLGPALQFAMRAQWETYALDKVPGLL